MSKITAVSRTSNTPCFGVLVENETLVVSCHDSTYIAVVGKGSGCARLVSPKKKEGMASRTL